MRSSGECSQCRIAMFCCLNSQLFQMDLMCVILCILCSTHDLSKHIEDAL